MMEALAAEEDRVPAYPVQKRADRRLRRAAAAGHQPFVAVGGGRVGPWACQQVSWWRC